MPPTAPRGGFAAIVVFLLAFAGCSPPVAHAPQPEHPAATQVSVPIERAPKPRPRVPIGAPDDLSDPEARRTTTVVVGGDLLWHSPTWYNAQADAARTGRGFGGFDFTPTFAAIRPLVQQADVAICHEDVPFAAPGAPFTSRGIPTVPPPPCGCGSPTAPRGPRFGATSVGWVPCGGCG